MARLFLIEADEQTATEIVVDLTLRVLVIECAGDGVIGLERARDETWDVVPLDRMLHGLDGLSIIPRRNLVGIVALVRSKQVIH